MKLNTKALTLTAAILWGGCFLLTGLANQVWPGYGLSLLNFGASVYPGYHGPSGFGSVMVMTMYAVVDGAVCGGLFALLYNALAKDAPA